VPAIASREPPHSTRAGRRSAECAATGVDRNATVTELFRQAGGSDHAHRVLSTSWVGCMRARTHFGCRSLGRRIASECAGESIFSRCGRPDLRAGKGAAHVYDPSSGRSASSACRGAAALGLNGAGVCMTRISRRSPRTAPPACANRARLTCSSSSNRRAPAAGPSAGRFDLRALPRRLWICPGQCADPVSAVLGRHHHVGDRTRAASSAISLCRCPAAVRR